MEAALLRNLRIVAKLVNFEPTPDILEFYIEALRPIGFEAANRGLHKLIKSAKRFPTVEDIEEAAGETPMSEKGQALAILGRILDAVGKFGWCNAVKAQQYIGDVGWDVMTRQPGGWTGFCERLTDENLEFTKAHVRDEIMAYLELRKRGLHNATTDHYLPKTDNGFEVQRLIADAAQNFQIK